MAQRMACMYLHVHVHDIMHDDDLTELSLHLHRPPSLRLR